MNRTKAYLANRSLILLSVVGLAFGSSWGANAQSIQHLSITQPGGMPGMPTVTGVQRGTNSVVVTWDGPAGYYQLFEKPDLLGTWKALGKATNLVRRATIGLLYSNAMFRVSGPAPIYAGSKTCLECHSSIVNLESHTRHAGAFTNQLFVAAGGQTNSSCLPCHTVGYGLPTGFVSQTKTPGLAGVQCENCHGPAANHAANPSDPVVRPRAEQAATVCGGCHTGAHQPTFNEWQASAHAQVSLNMNPTNRIDSCGRCHSGNARSSLLRGKPLPKDDANMGIVCTTCHDPHQKTAHPAQLRNPVASTNDYSLATSDSFKTAYDPNINICAQCHNQRGAAWTNTGSPPHHSPQYNMLLGTAGELNSGLKHYDPAAHALWIPNQCVGCHMPTAPFESATLPAVTGHKFTVDSFDLCRDCHPSPEALVDFTKSAISSQIAEVKTALDLWASTKAPEALRSKYGVRAWEYTAPGVLSSGGAGPNATEQQQIPVNIQKARFNLYIVLNDGSYGVHNGPFSVTLLDTAYEWVQTEITK